MVQRKQCQLSMPSTWGIGSVQSMPSKKARPAPSPRDATSLVPAAAAAAAAADAEVLGKLPKSVTRNSTSMNSFIIDEIQPLFVTLRNKKHDKLSLENVQSRDKNKSTVTEFSVIITVTTVT
jgi:hypothetical protein